MNADQNGRYGEVRCDCCDLPVESCGRAVERRQRQEQQAGRAALLAHGWFAAQWPGTCGVCGERFDAGDLISLSPATGWWRSECCPSAPVAKPGSGE